MRLCKTPTGMITIFLLSIIALISGWRWTDVRAQQSESIISSLHREHHREQRDESDSKDLLNEPAERLAKQTAREAIQVLDQFVYTPIIQTEAELESDNFSAEFERDVIEIVNAERSAAGCGPVSANPILRTAAYGHSQDMGENNYFSHSSQNGDQFWDRAAAAGYDGFAAAENIAAGQPSAAQVMQGWMRSDGHRRNILNCNYNEVGVGYYLTDTIYRHYWTQLFGIGQPDRPGSNPTETPSATEPPPSATVPATASPSATATIVPSATSTTTPEPTALPTLSATPEPEPSATATEPPVTREPIATPIPTDRPGSTIPTRTPTPEQRTEANRYDLETAIIGLINQERAQAGCGAVRFDAGLQQAAALHSQDMAQNGYFSHTGQNGSQFWDRAIAAGYDGFATGENIAAGHATAAEVVAGWMDSPGHRDNILTCSHTEMGVGYYYSDQGYHHYWTQIFGQR